MLVYGLFLLFVKGKLINELILLVGYIDGILYLGVLLVCESDVLFGVVN